MSGNFALTDQDGQRFQLDQLKGKVVLLFFGYTFCPDICPTELTNLSRVLDTLDGESVQGVFVTVDPDRDTPEVLKDYTDYFNRRLIGLTGSPAQIDRVTQKYRVKFRKLPVPGGSYSMNHPSNLYLIDRTGKLSTIVPYGLPPEHVVDVVRHLLAENL
ncbi:MAG: SCO family protein [Gammaproteobacteria bacterium]|nr:SCO family protein [Gammaproteobacteria bacterium]